MATGKGHSDVRTIWTFDILGMSYAELQCLKWCLIEARNKASDPSEELVALINIVEDLED